MSRHHHHVLAAAAAALAASLLLTACGGSDEEAPSDKIEGAEDKESAPASPSDGAAERPKIALPKDIKYVFEWETDKPAGDAVLRDVEQYIQAVELAIAEQDPVHEAYRFYSEGEAAAGTQEYVQDFVDHKARTTGTNRYYNATLSIKSADEAALVYCEDQSKAFNKDLKTGKVDVTPVSKDSYVVYNSSLRKNDQGVWVIEKLLSESGAPQCQP